MTQNNHVKITCQKMTCKMTYFKLKKPTIKYILQTINIKIIKDKNNKIKDN